MPSTKSKPPLAANTSAKTARLLAILHLGDDEASARHANYRPAWNRTLRLFNLLQFLPGALWITRQGVQAGRYPEFSPAGEPPSELEVPGLQPGEARGARWSAVEEERGAMAQGVW